MFVLQFFPKMIPAVSATPIKIPVCFVSLLLFLVEMDPLILKCI